MRSLDKKCQIKKKKNKLSKSQDPCKTNKLHSPHSTEISMCIIENI